MNKQNAILEKSKKFAHEIIVNEYDVFLALLTQEELNCNKSKKPIPSERKTLLQIRCSHHPLQGIQVTTVFNYLRSRTGLSCCGRQQVSTKLVEREFSSETIHKMSEARKKFFAEKGKNNQTKENKDRNEYSEWRAIVYKNGFYSCAITGIRPQILNAHHLFSKKAFASIRFDPQNGISLSAEIHQAFHDCFGTLNIVTIDHFMKFLEALIKNENCFRENLFKKVIPRRNSDLYSETISSQLSYNAEKDTGPETIVRSDIYNVERLQNLHQHMTELKKTLFSKLSEKEEIFAKEAFSRAIVARGLNTNSFDNVSIEDESCSED